MIKRFRKAAALGLFAVLAVLGLHGQDIYSWAAGNWSTLPIVGETSFCASNVSGVVLPTAQGPYGIVPGSTQGTGQGICGQTVPAGPPDLTGSELVPADTEVGATGAAQTVTVPVPTLASGAYQLFSNAGLASFTASMNNNVTNAIVNATGSLTELTWTLPAAPLDGQVVRLASNQSITTLVVSTQGLAGQKVNNSPASLTTSTSGSFGYALIYQASSNAWYRLQ